MRVLLFFSAVVLLTTISCKKDAQENVESKPDSYEVKKNSQPWPGNKFEGNLTGVDKQLTIFLHGQGEEYIAITLKEPIQIGDKNGFNAVYYKLVGGDVIIDAQQLDKTKPYQLEITSFNAETKRIVGNFSFTLNRDERFTESIGAQSNLFTGQFNIGYKTYGQ